MRCNLSSSLSSDMKFEVQVDPWRSDDPLSAQSLDLQELGKVKSLGCSSPERGPKSGLIWKSSNSPQRANKIQI